MICNVCGSSESYVQDGVEYCRECSEQVKDSIDEDAGDGVCIKKSLLSSPVSKKEKKKKTKALAPWLYHEAYNVILNKQVSALIQLGCSEKLKTVVLSLWTRYLQKCELAFIKSTRKEGFLPRLSVFASKRDIEILYGEGLSTNLKNIKRPHFKVTRRVDPRRKSKGKVTLKIKKEEISSHSVSEPESSAAEQYSDSSNQDTVVKINRRKRPGVLYSFHARKLRRQGYKKSNVQAQETCISHMTHSKTLSFLLLGLLYTEDQMLLFDLIRLVNEGAIPFIDVIRHFPTTMQLQADDFSYFNNINAPDIKKISFTAAQLITFLQLPKFKQPPLLPIAIRFVKDLNLPCELIPLLKLLINTINSDELYELKPIHTKNNSLPIYEAQAMSVIAVALKMIFVLDGKFEDEHSEIMTKLNSITEDQTYFVWKDWQKQMALKEYLFMKKYSINKLTMSRLDCLIADRINEGYPVRSIHQKLVTNVTRTAKNIYATRNELKTLFENLVENNALKRTPTSFPLQYELHSLRTNWGTLSLFKDTENIDFSFINKDFSQYKLYYNPSTTIDETKRLLLSSLYESVKLIHVTECEEYYENIIRTSKKYWLINHNISDYTGRKFIDDFPSSFKWLFNFMCKYIQIEKHDFYKEFRYIEQKLIQ